LPRRPGYGLIPGMGPHTVLALLGCDRASRTRGRGGYDLLGVFYALNLKLPTTLTLAVYYAFTGCHGAADLELVFLDPDDEPLARGPVTIPLLAGPLNIVGGAGTFNAVPIPRPGTYRLVIELRSEVLAERPILLGPARTMFPYRKSYIRSPWG